MLIKSGDYFIVMWYEPTHLPWYSDEKIEFPVKDLDVRIEHYKNKLKYAFRTRNRIK